MHNYRIQRSRAMKSINCLLVPMITQKLQSYFSFRKTANSPNGFSRLRSYELYLVLVFSLLERFFAAVKNVDGVLSNATSFEDICTVGLVCYLQSLQIDNRTFYHRDFSDLPRACWPR